MKQEKVELLLNATGLECPENPKLNMTKTKSQAVHHSNLNQTSSDIKALSSAENSFHGNNFVSPESPTTLAYKPKTFRSSIKTIGPFSAFNPN